MSSSNIYQSVGYRSGNIGFGKKAAILVVDFQKAFTSKESQLGGSKLITDAVIKTKSLIQKVRKQNLPIIHTVVAYREDKQDMGLWPQKVKALSEVKLGSVWAEVDDELEVQEDEVILTKKMPSAFFNTDLTNILISQGVDTVIVTGCTTSGCIRATTIDAFSYGFRTIVVKDCVGDQDIKPHEANLFDIENRYCDVLSSEDVIALLN
ncbi:isochorismatase family protein [Salinibacillus xinjiangensis]|uniref:Isochorismatase family protein n=1 Tax=Salinibacillus xinjiangensis TaxID=1229268 RepID=A0A6G1X1T1_9BACI|nr:isochorismatase family protein [Salinibacillus xinjiangensis]MRG84845.1 isochorismatase family protein [Salinibacillus xinjiangensis]